MIDTVAAEQFSHLTAQVERFNNLQLAANKPAQTQKKPQKRRWISFNRVKRVFRRIDRKVTTAVRKSGQAVGRATGWVVSQPVSWVDRPAGKRVRETGQEVLGRLGAEGAQFVFAKTPAGMKFTRWKNQFKRAIDTVENAENMVKQAPAMLGKMARQEFRQRVNEAQQRVERSLQKRRDRFIRKYEPKVNKLKDKYHELRKRGRELEERARWVTDPAAKLQMEAERKLLKERERLLKKANERYEKLREKGEEVRQRLEASFQKRVEPVKKAYDKVVEKIERAEEKLEAKRQKVEDKIEHAIDKVDKKLEKGERKFERLKEKVREIFAQFPRTPPTVPGQPTMSDEDRRKAEREAKREAEAADAVDKAVADAVRKAKEKQRLAALQKKQKQKAEEDARRKEEERLQAEKDRLAAEEKAKRKAAEEAEAKRRAGGCDEYDPTNPECETGAAVTSDKQKIQKALAKKKAFEKAAPDKLAKTTTGGRAGTARTDMADVKAEVRDKAKQVERPDEDDRLAKRDRIAEEYGTPPVLADKPATAPKTTAPKTTTPTVTTKAPVPRKVTPAEPTPVPEPKPVVNFAGTWSSKRVCAEAGEGSDYSFTWKVALTQTGDVVRGTIYFHNCPCGGRASYSVSGKATADKKVKLKGTLGSSRGPLAKYVPQETTFTIVKNGTPSPNYGPGRTSPCED
ncbi:hypothetical protein ACFL3A_02960 [Pseudomonadota bacterium]